MFTRRSRAHKTLCALMAFTFAFTLITPPRAGAQVASSLLNLPMPGAMVTVTPGFTPPLIKGITIHPENPLLFDFIVNSGEENVQGEALAREATKMIKYFLATLTTPEEELWVNLSPYEKDRIIPQKLGETAMGRDMLAQDYLLKQLTSSLMYPEDALGSEFWQRVHTKAYEQFGTTDIPVDTFNKVWIVPEKATLIEKDNSVFVIDSHLKVMLDQDYVAQQHSVGADLRVRPVAPTTDDMQSEIIREVLLPEIEKEVNEGKTFAQLRQIYNAMILATWYKINLKESLLGQVYVDQNKIKGVDVADKDIKNKIYNQYLEAFSKGVYNYIKEDYDPATQEIIPRKYFSGGFAASPVSRSSIGAIVQAGTILPRSNIAVTPEGNANTTFEISLVEADGGTVAASPAVAEFVRNDTPLVHWSKSNDASPRSASPVVVSTEVKDYYDTAIRDLTTRLGEVTGDQISTAKRGGIQKQLDRKNAIRSLLQSVEGREVRLEIQEFVQELSRLIEEKQGASEINKFEIQNASLIDEWVKALKSSSSPTKPHRKEKEPGRKILGNQRISDLTHNLLEGDLHVREEAARQIGRVVHADEAEKVIPSLRIVLAREGEHFAVRKEAALALLRIGAEDWRARSALKEIEGLKFSQRNWKFGEEIKSAIAAARREYQEHSSSAASPLDLKKVKLYSIEVTSERYGTFSNRAIQNGKNLMVLDHEDWEYELVVDFEYMDLVGVTLFETTRHGNVVVKGKEIKKFNVDLRGKSLEGFMGLIIKNLDQSAEPDENAQAVEEQGEVSSSPLNSQKKLEQMILIKSAAENLISRLNKLARLMVERKRDEGIQEWIQSIQRMLEFNQELSNAAHSGLAPNMPDSFKKKFEEEYVDPYADDLDLSSFALETAKLVYSAFLKSGDRAALVKTVGDYARSQYRDRLADSLRATIKAGVAQFDVGNPNVIVHFREVLNGLNQSDSEEQVDRVDLITSLMGALEHYQESIADNAGKLEKFNSLLDQSPLENLTFLADKMVEAKLLSYEDGRYGVVSQEQDQDSAASPVRDRKYGGIDFNPALLDLQIKRDGNGVPLPVWQQPLATMNIEGFIPVIINIVPTGSVPMLLGLAGDEEDGEEDTTAARGLGPVDNRMARAEGK